MTSIVLFPNAATNRRLPFPSYARWSMRPSTFGIAIVFDNSKTAASAPNNVPDSTSMAMRITRHILTSSLSQSCVQRIEDFEALRQNLFVRHFQHSKAHQHAVDSEALRALEF